MADASSQPALSVERPATGADPAQLREQRQDLWQSSSLAGSARLGSPVRREPYRQIDVFRRITGTAQATATSAGSGRADREHDRAEPAGQVVYGNRAEPALGGGL